MERAEYVRIKLSNITQELIYEYDLTKHTCDVWAYFEILIECYGLPQTVKLENDILCTLLIKFWYYEAATTPVLWGQKYFPIIFGLIIDNFGIEYVGERHAHHLIQTLQENYTITTD